jgi:hypothetical protein
MIFECLALLRRVGYGFKYMMKCFSSIPWITNKWHVTSADTEADTLLMQMLIHCRYSADALLHCHQIQYSPLIQGIQTLPESKESKLRNPNSP